MLQKSVRSVALFFAIVLSVGCSRDGTFERPDSIEVMTPEAVHGIVGHLIGSITVAKEGEEIVRQVVLVLRDSDVSTAPMFLIARYSSGAPHAVDENAVAVVKIIDALHAAVSVALVPSLPEGTKQEGGIKYGSDYDIFVCYLRVTTPSDTLYWSVWVTQKTRDEIIAQLAKPPAVIDTRPAQVVEISYYLDETLTQPLTDVVMIGDTVYTKVVFSKDVPVTLANDSRARPRISSSVGSQTFQYRMKPRGTVLESGDAKPYRDSNRVFVGMYRVGGRDFRSEFHTSTGRPTVTGSPLQVKTYRYDADGIPPNTGTTIVDWHPNDFVGRVYTLPPDDQMADRSIPVPLAGVTVTIMAGTRAGESIVTDRNGRYRFLNIPTDSLHLRADRPRYEPKEVIAYRSQPTALSDGSVPNYWRDPQKQPGNILMGLVWPDEVRFILEEILLPYDLLYFEFGPSKDRVVGFYGDGIVIMYSDSMTDLSFLPILAHELMHAHQHAIGSIDGTVSLGNAMQSLWPASPEGKAFAVAREKDWAEVGTTGFDRVPRYRDRLNESAAETAAYYWGANRWRALSRHDNLEEVAPNRWRWAVEWLSKK